MRPETVENDSIGRRLAWADALDRTTEFIFDGRGDLISIKDPEGNPLDFTYDSRGNQTAYIAYIDGEGRKTSEVYDELGRLIRIVDEAPDPDHVTSLAYDVAGNLVEITDPEGRKTTYEHDRLLV